MGRHIVEQLLERGDPVAVLDLVQRHHDVPFYSGDISDEAQVSQAIQKVRSLPFLFQFCNTHSLLYNVQSGATCIIHTASPHSIIGDAALFWKVNVEGTKAIIAAAVANGLKKLVYTSSASVVFNGQDLIDVDERLPPPERPLDAYNESKAKAEELVLAANGKGGLYTVALRPAGIFGFVPSFCILHRVLFRICFPFLVGIDPETEQRSPDSLKSSKKGKHTSK